MVLFVLFTILCFAFRFKKFRPPHRTTISVRRHAYVQQTFAPIQSISEDDMRHNLRAGSNYTTENNHIHMILPLKGRAEIFARYVCLQ